MLFLCGRGLAERSAGLHAKWHRLGNQALSRQALSCWRGDRKPCRQSKRARKSLCLHRREDRRARYDAGVSWPSTLLSRMLTCRQLLIMAVVSRFGINGCLQNWFWKRDRQSQLAGGAGYWCRGQPEVGMLETL